MKPKRFRPIALLSAAMLLALASCGEGEASSASSSASAEPSSSQKTQDSSNTSSGTTAPSSSSSSSSSSQKEKTRLTLYLRDGAFVYDGQPHSLEVTSPNHIPEALVIEYTNNGQVNAGTYTVTARITDPTGLYDFESTLTATLTIDPAKIDLDDFVFEDKVVKYDGFAKTIQATGYPDHLPPVYVIRDSYGNTVEKAINVGQYTVTASFQYDNYVSASFDASLIIEPGTIDQSKIVFEDLTIEYDGLYHKIVATGEIPAGIEIEYNYDQGWCEVGEYTVTATFYSPEGNYESFTKTATLKIVKGQGPAIEAFQDTEVTYNFAGRTLNVDYSKIPSDVSVRYNAYDEEGNLLNASGITALGGYYDTDSSGSFTSIYFCNAGTYAIEAYFFGGAYEYAPVKKTLKINKLVIEEMPWNLTMEDLVADYDGEEHSIQVKNAYGTTADYFYYTIDSGAQHEIGYTVQYENNDKVEIGEYAVVATIVPDNANVTLAPTLNATLTIGEPPAFTDGLQFRNEGKSYAVSGYTGSETEIEIPVRYKGLPVTSIESLAFSRARNYNKITKITIAEGITTINSYAFRTLFGLKELYLPASLTDFNVNALPGIESEYGPRDCIVYTPQTRDEVKWTGWDDILFHGSIVFGYTGNKGEASDLSVTTHISGNKTLMWADTKEGRIISKIKDVGPEITPDIVLPSQIDGVDVIGLAFGAGQAMTHVTKVAFPSAPFAIGERAFYADDTLFQMKIPSTISSIGPRAFGKCDNLVLYVEDSEAPETFDENWLADFPFTTAVHYDYKNTIISAESSSIFDYRLDGDDNAIIVATHDLGSSWIHIAIPEVLDGHNVVGLDDHALACPNSVYATLSGNLVEDKISSYALKSTTLGYVTRDGYLGYINTTAYTPDSFNKSRFVVTDDTAYLLYPDNGNYPDRLTLVRIITNRKSFTLGTSITDGESTYNIVNLLGKGFEGNQTTEAITVEGLKYCHNLTGCLGLKRLFLGNSNITHLDTMQGAVNLEEVILPETLTSSINTNTPYYNFALRFTEDGNGNFYLPTENNPYYYHVNSVVPEGTEGVVLKEGCHFLNLSDLQYATSRFEYLDLPATIERYGGATRLSTTIFARGNLPFDIQEARIIRNYAGVHGVTDDGFRYAKTTDGATIYKYEGEEAEVVFPASVDGAPVTEIASNTIVSTSAVTSIVIPEGVKRLDDNFINYLYGLESLTLPDSIEQIGQFTVYKSSFAFHEENGGKYIGNENNPCIYLYGLVGGATEVVVSDACMAIRNGIFEGTSVTSVTLPDTLKEMPSFQNCQKLVSVNIPSAVTSLPERVFQSCSALNCDIVIPEGVEEIPVNAFNGCNTLRSVSLPSTLRVINSNAFYNCYLLRVDLPSMLQTIEASAFYRCQQVIVYRHVTYVGSSAFYNATVYYEGSEAPAEWNSGWNYQIGKIYYGYKGTGVEGHFSYIIYEGYLHIIGYDGDAESFALPDAFIGGYSSYVFHASAINEIEGITALATNSHVAALEGNFTSITDLTLNHSLEGQEAYILSLQEKDYRSVRVLISFNGLKNLTFGEEFGTVSLLYLIGRDVSLEKVTVKSKELPANWLGSEYTITAKEVVIAEGVTIIPEHFNVNSSEKEIVLPSTVTSIGKYAFNRSLFPEIVSLPEGLTFIGQRAFNEIPSTFYVPSSVQTIETQAFGSSAWNWGYYAYVVMDKGCAVTSIDGWASSNKTKVFHGASGTIVKDEDTSMFFYSNADGYSLFRYVGTSLDVVVPDAIGTTPVTEIGGGAFEGSAITSIALGADVERIGDRAFYNCKYITSLTLNEGLTSIGAYAFYKAFGACLELELPSSVRSIGNSAFLDLNKGFNKIVLNDGLLTIGESAFSGACNNNSVETVVIVVPESVVTIGSWALAASGMGAWAYGWTSVFVQATELPEGWDSLFAGNNNIRTSHYFYSETKPTSGNIWEYWHWVDGVPTVWTNND